MRKILISDGKFIVGIYCALTIIKLFTVCINSPSEKHPIYCLTIRPTLGNIFYASDKAIIYYESMYKWREMGFERQFLRVVHSSFSNLAIYELYKKHQYWQLFYGDRIEYVYNTLIFLWWIMSIGLIVFAFYKLLLGSIK